MTTLKDLIVKCPECGDYVDRDFDIEPKTGYCFGCFFNAGLQHIKDGNADRSHQDNSVRG